MAAAAASVSAGEESRIDDALNASLTLALQEKKLTIMVRKSIEDTPFVPLKMITKVRGQEGR